MWPFRQRRGVEIPREITKYFRSNEYSFVAIESSQFWMANPSTLNDPFDLNLTVRPSHPSEIEPKHIEAITNMLTTTPVYEKTTVVEDGEEKIVYLDKSVDSTLGQAGPEVIAHILMTPELAKTPQALCGITCFSAHSASPVMWAHYADSGRGFAVTYKPKGKRVADNLYRIGDLSFGAVNYEFEYPEVRTLDIFDDANRLYITMSLTKGIHWQYEQEWRLLSQFGDQLIECPFPVDKVILGQKMSADNKLRVLKPRRHSV